MNKHQQNSDTAINGSNTEQLWAEI